MKSLAKPPASGLVPSASRSGLVFEAVSHLLAGVDPLVEVPREWGDRVLWSGDVTTYRSLAPRCPAKPSP